MRIGIDIDGVLTDMEQFAMDFFTKYCYENNIPIKIKPNEYYETEAFSLSSEQAEKFWNQYLAYYATEYPARIFASEIINKLKQEGNDIYIITARNEYGLPPELYGKMKQLVEKWLEDNKIFYDKIFYTENSKLQYCIDNKIDIMIEDCMDNVKEISTIIPVLCYNAQYNIGLEGKNIIRVYSWYDIYYKIQNSINKKGSIK